MRPSPIETPPLQLAEGPAWEEATGTVSFVDVAAGALHRFRLHGDGTQAGPVETLLRMDEPVTFALPHVAGGWVLGHGRSVSHLSATGDLTTLVGWLQGAGPGVRVNDAATDPAGRVLAGTMAYDARTPSGALYRIDSDRSVWLLRDGIVCSNGIGWYGDRMYHADTIERRVDVYAYDVATGAVGTRELFVGLDTGSPDGLSVDQDGHVWLAVWGAGQIRRYDPSGREVASVELPHRNVTSTCFAGDDLSTLVITTAEQVFTLRVDVPGSPCAPARTAIPGRYGVGRGVQRRRELRMPRAGAPLHGAFADPQQLGQSLAAGVEL